MSKGRRSSRSAFRFSPPRELVLEDRLLPATFSVSSMHLSVAGGNSDRFDYAGPIVPFDQFTSDHDTDPHTVAARFGSGGNVASSQQVLDPGVHVALDFTADLPEGAAGTVVDLDANGTVLVTTDGVFQGPAILKFGLHGSLLVFDPPSSPPSSVEVPYSFNSRVTASAALLVGGTQSAGVSRSVSGSGRGFEFNQQPSQDNHGPDWEDSGGSIDVSGLDSFSMDFHMHLELSVPGGPLQVSAFSLIWMRVFSLTEGPKPPFNVVAKAPRWNYPVDDATREGGVAAGFDLVTPSDPPVPFEVEAYWAKDNVLLGGPLVSRLSTANELIRREVVIGKKALGRPPVGSNQVVIRFNNDRRVTESNYGDNTLILDASPMAVLSDPRTLQVQIGPGLSATAQFDPVGGALDEDQFAVICGVDHFNYLVQLVELPHGLGIEQSFLKTVPQYDSDGHFLYDKAYEENQPAALPFVVPPPHVRWDPQVRLNSSEIKTSWTLQRSWPFHFDLLDAHGVPVPWSGWDRVGPYWNEGDPVFEDPNSLKARHRDAGFGRTELTFQGPFVELPDVVAIGSQVRFLAQLIGVRPKDSFGDPMLVPYPQTRFGWTETAYAAFAPPTPWVPFTPPSPSASRFRPDANTTLEVAEGVPIDPARLVSQVQGWLEPVDRAIFGEAVRQEVLNVFAQAGLFFSNLVDVSLDQPFLARVGGTRAVFTIGLPSPDPLGGWSDLRDLNVRVTNVAPKFNTLPSVVPALTKKAIGLPVSFTDPGFGPWTVDVDYGDGTHGHFLREQADAGQPIALSHAYARAGSYRMTMQVSDGIDSDTRKVTVQVTDRPDTTPPKVVQINTTTKNGNLSEVVVTFSEAMAEAVAGLASSYQFVLDPGKDRVFGTKDDKVVKVGSAIYDPVKHTVRLRPVSVVSLKKPVSLLVPEGAKVADVSGNRLTPLGSPVRGRAFLRRLRVGVDRV